MNMNQSSNGPDLGRVVMPIIEVMRQSGLSWAEREKCAFAILECLRHHKSMADERTASSQSALAGQQQSALDKLGKP